MYRLLRSQRIKKSSDFARFRIKKTRVFRCSWFVLKVAKAEISGKQFEKDIKPRIGIVTSKKVGNAPQRNRIRRVVREAFRMHPTVFKENYDYLFIALKGSASKSNREITRELLMVASFKGQSS